MCFVPAVKSSAVDLTILCFFVFTKREQVVTALPVYINSFCYSVIFEAFIQFTPKLIVDSWSRSCKRKVFFFFFFFFFF